MKDLANERDAVCRRLESSNFEPVNAEGWHPDGARSWERISQEIRSSDAFVLILGTRYGWVPRTGPGAMDGLSVTHLEFRQARRLGLPVLPFLMRLDYDIDRESVDAKQRDAFRMEVQDWDQGIFAAQFNLARDLAEGVGEAVIKLLTDRFLRTKIESRIAEADAVSSLLQQERPHAVGDVQVPRLLSAAVTKREAVLFAGAGISAAAGLPSAGVFSSAVARVIRECVPDYGVSPVASMFSAIASDVEAFASRELLVHEVKSIVNPPHGLQPTAAHQAAVRLFDLILTSNWDALFERAAEAAGIDLPIIIGEISDPLPTRCLVKLHGTPEEPESLMLSEDDILLMDKTRKRLCEEVRSILKNRILVVIGSSLRDPSIVKLFIEAAPQCQNYFISPSITDASTARLRKWNFTPIVADADSFMKALATGV